MAFKRTFLMLLFFLACRIILISLPTFMKEKNRKTTNKLKKYYSPDGIKNTVFGELNMNSC